MNISGIKKWSAGITALVSLFLCTTSLAQSARPRYIYINETDRHAHDLALKMSLKLAEKRSGIENALVLLKKLPDQVSLEETAADFFERWAIGRDRGGKGLLFLYSEEENLFRIEVSYALEGIFPDALCRHLEEAAKTYMLSDTPQDFLSELLITMNIQGEENKAELERFDTPVWLGSTRLSGGAGSNTQGYRRNLNEIIEAIGRLPKEKLKAFEPGLNPEETLERYLRSLELGLGDPQLPFLTEGSRVFRWIIPRNRAQQMRVFDYYRKAMPFQLLYHGDLALAVFRPGTANLPIVLRRSREGLWYVDEPKSWTYFHRFEDGVDFYPKYDDIPFMNELQLAGHPHARRPVYRRRVLTPRVISYPFSLTSYARTLEKNIDNNPTNDRAYADLGEFYLFEIGWIKKALEMFEKASFLDPQRIEYRWRLYDLYLNDSQMEKALAQLKFLADALPEDKEVQEWHDFYTDAYRFKPGEFA